VLHARAVRYYYFLKNTVPFAICKAYGIFIFHLIPYQAMPRRAWISTSPAAQVRAWFGLRQDELALYLGVSPGMVRHLESGRRALSADVLAALLPLVQHLPSEAELLAALAAASSAPAGIAAAPAPPSPPALAPGSPPPQAAALTLRRRACLLHAARLRTQAEALAYQATVAARWAAALPTLLAALPPAENPEPHALPPAKAAGPATTAPTKAVPTAEAAAPVEAAPAAKAAVPTEATAFHEASPLTEGAVPSPAGPAAFDRAAWLRGWLTRRARPLPPEAATRYHLLLARAAAHTAEADALAAALAAG